MSDQILALDNIRELADGQFSFAERVNYLKKYGQHSQSFSTLQPGMQYFDVPGMGYIAYMRKWGGTFVLSDSVSAPEHFPAMLEKFQQTFPNACYIQVSKSVVDFLHLRFGLYGTQFGCESRIDLKSWSLTGKKKQILRTALNQAEKSGITVMERFSDDHTREISEAWIRTRKCKSNEIRFLIRPMEMDYRENERHFYAYQLRTEYLPRQRRFSTGHFLHPDGPRHGHLQGRRCALPGPGPDSAIAGPGHRAPGKPITETFDARHLRERQFPLQLQRPGVHQIPLPG